MNSFIDAILESDNQDDKFDLLWDITHLNLDGKFYIKDLGVTSRVFNHWINMGLVTGVSKVSDYKFEFGFIELIWLSIVNELRGFGFPLEKIKMVKQHLMDEFLLMETIEHFDKHVDRKKILNHRDILGVEYENEMNQVKKSTNEFLHPNNIASGMKGDIQVSSLQLIVSRFLFDRADVKILIDMNGTVFPVTKNSVFNEDLAQRMEDGGFESESHISISVMKFMKKFICKSENEEFVRKNKILNENELYILSLIKEGKAHAITIKFDGQKPTHIEITSKKKIYAESRISEILLKHGYQDITIKTQDGNIAFSNVTIKKKLK